VETKVVYMRLEATDHESRTKVWMTDEEIE
jgi:hypothetical protein